MAIFRQIFRGLQSVCVEMMIYDLGACVALPFGKRARASIIGGASGERECAKVD